MKFKFPYISSFRCLLLAAIVVLGSAPLAVLCLWAGIPWFETVLVSYFASLILLLIPASRARQEKTEALWTLLPIYLLSAFGLPVFGLGVTLLFPVIFLPMYLWGFLPLSGWYSRRFSGESCRATTDDTDCSKWSFWRWGVALALSLAMYANCLGLAILLDKQQTNNLQLAETLSEWGIPVLTPAQYTCHLLAEYYLWPVDVPPPGTCWGEPKAVLKQYRATGDRWSGIVTPDSAVLAAHEKLEKTGFGMHFEITGEAKGVIVDVEAGSPAERAGVRRGDRVLRVGTEAADQVGLLALAYGIPFMTTLRTRDGQMRTIDWSSDEARYLSAALPQKSIVLKHAGKRIAYLHYRHFAPESSQTMVEEIRQLKAQGVGDVVVDLRNNGGGHVATVQTLGALLGGGRVAGKELVETEIVINGKHVQDTEHFAPLGELTTLDLERIVFLTSRQTCSASERLIYGLSRYMPVATIGEPTCGKPYGFVPRTYQGQTWLLVNSVARDAQGGIAYPQGIAPSCVVRDDAGREYGDPQEPLLRAALGYLASGRCAGQT